MGLKGYAFILTHTRVEFVTQFRSDLDMVFVRRTRIIRSSRKKNTLIIFVFIKGPYLYGRAEQFRESRSKNIIGIMKSHCVREYNNIKRTHTFRRFFQITTLSFRTNSKIDPEIGRPRQFKR